MFKLSGFILIAAIVMLAPLSVGASTLNQTWIWANFSSNTIDEARIFIETPGVTFATPGVSPLPNWTAMAVNSQYVFITNPLQGTDLQAPIDFATDGNVPFVFNIYGFLSPSDGTPVFTGHANWNGGGDGGAWVVNFGAVTATGATQSLSAENTAAPEPASFILLGSGLLLASIYRRRRKTS